MDGELDGERERERGRVGRWVAGWLCEDLNPAVLYLFVYTGTYWKGGGVSDEDWRYDG